MRIIECKYKERAEGVGFGRALDNINLSFGRQSQSVEEFLLQALQKRLDHRFVCLRNYFPNDTSQSSTLVLLSPQAIVLFQVSPLKGIFRAVGDVWEELDTRSKKYYPVKANIILETLGTSKELGMRLARIETDLPKIEPVIYFVNPGAHIEVERPAARILLVDALDRFLSNLLHMPAVIDPEVLEKLANSMQESCSPQSSKASKPSEPDIFSLRDVEEKKPSKKMLISTPFQQGPGILKKLRFSRGQWILLSILFIVTILVLVALVLVVLILT